MQPYALLMIAAAWHAMGVGTIGLRGRIVAGICGAGFIWGALTPPWGWVQIGCAVATCGMCRWSVTEQGRAAWLAGCRLFVTWLADVLRGIVSAVAFVFSPPRTYEAVSVELCEPVSTPGDTRQIRFPHGDRWNMMGPGVSRGDTAQEVSVVPPMTYESVIADTAAEVRPYNEAARLVKSMFGYSRSKFARDVRVFRASTGERQVA